MAMAPYKYSNLPLPLDKLYFVKWIYSSESMTVTTMYSVLYTGMMYQCREQGIGVRCILNNK